MSEPGILPNPIPFGKYYLLERINVGGMAEVYKAKAFGVEGFERLLAVKKILSSIAEDEAFINMFIDEAKIAGQLNHPNIAQIFDLGKVDGSYFIALEYIGGKDLKTIFERARRLGEKVSIPRVCYFIMKVCEGLGHAHAKKGPDGNDLNIVHRDVSPQNVLISYEGEVKIIDFGIAKAQGKTSQTQVGILKGKFSYMSPEQVRGLHIDHRSDIFSLGIVLYELLTLERLFLGESDFDTLEKIRKVEMSPPSLYNPHIPKELEDIVLKALARSPDDRYSDSGEFAEALERFMRSQGYYFTNKDLAAYMKESFSADIEFENKKLEYYKSLNLKPIDGEAPGAAKSNGTAPSNPNAGLSWGEEEMETQIFDRMDDEEFAEELDEADIVYAKDAGDTDEVPTMEYDRWKNEGNPGMEFDDDPPPEKRNGRARQPTAQMAAVEPRRVPSGTVHAVRNDNRGKNIGIALIVFVVVVGLGVFAMSKFMAKAPLIVETVPNEVQVVVNGKVVHDGEYVKTPFNYELAMGETKIELKREGFKTFETAQTIETANEYRLNVELEPLVTKVEFLVKSDPPGAEVFVNGTKQDAPTPMTLKDLEGEKAALKVTKEGFFDHEQELDLKNPPESVDVRLKPAKVALKVTSVPDRAEYTVEDAEGNKVASGRTPDTLKELDASKTYTVKVERKKYENWSQNFEPGFDPEPVLEANLRRADEAVASSNNNSVFRPPQKDPPKKDPPKKDPPQKDPPKKDPPKKDPPKKDPVAKGTGTISVASKPVARVYIDGSDTGRYTPLMNFKIESGKHKIQLKNPDFGLSKTYYITVKPGESKRIINKP